MPKICANYKVIVHSQWPRVEDATSVVKALIAIANSQTHGVGGGYPAPLLLRAGEENECMEEKKMTLTGSTTGAWRKRTVAM